MLVKYVHIDDAKTCCQFTLELESFKSWTHLCLDGKPGEMLPYVVLWDHDTLEISSSAPPPRKTTLQMPPNHCSYFPGIQYTGNQIITDPSLHKHFFDQTESFSNLCALPLLLILTINKEKNKASKIHTTAWINNPLSINSTSWVSKMVQWVEPVAIQA